MTIEPAALEGAFEGAFEGLITPTALADRLADADWAIVDCRFSLADPSLGEQQYAAGHIPGAVYAHLDRDLSSPAQELGGRHPLPPLDRLAATLGHWGIGPQTWVAIYDNSRFGFAARLWWLLRYLGHDRAVLLDGGWSAWVAAGLPTTTEIPQPAPQVFEPQVRSQLFVTIEQVQRLQGSGQGTLIDSREPARYRGEEEPIDPVAGRIPGAVNYPWQAVCDDAGQARSPEALRDHFQAIDPDHPPVVYCGSGVTACVNLWALARAGRADGRLYGGSWSDWCARPELPVVTQSSLESMAATANPAS
ncbi:MAG: sulfurtransferase [Oscillatoriales cyanobacterium]|nr:MAG: sulfurtransferase [Oscillatoriales cyanobacterium]